MKQNWLQEPIEGTWQRMWAGACTDLRQLCLPHIVRSCHLGGYFAHREQNSPPKYWGNISEIAHLNFTTPIIISVFYTKLGETPFQTHHFPMNMALSFSFCFILFCLSFSHPLHRIEFGQQKLFSKTFRFSMKFYSTLQIFGGGHFRKACRSREK